MPRVDSIGTTYDGSMRIQRVVKCNCPFDDMVDLYMVYIQIDPVDLSIELKSLNDYLDWFSQQEFSQEDLTKHISSALCHIPNCKVITIGSHYGEVTVCEV